MQEKPTCVRKGVHLQFKVAVGAISQLIVKLSVRIASNEVMVVLLTRMNSLMIVVLIPIPGRRTNLCDSGLSGRYRDGRDLGRGVYSPCWYRHSVFFLPMRLEPFVYCL